LWLLPAGVVSIIFCCCPMFTHAHLQAACNSDSNNNAKTTATSATITTTRDPAATTTTTMTFKRLEFRGALNTSSR